jgi:hypothetical protein
VSLSSYGEGTGRYWVYEPAEPRPDSAPVVVYLHGFGVFEPSLYDAQLRHLSRKGYVVVFPLYGYFDLESYEADARAAIAAALVELETGPEHVRPNGQLAYAAHSLGAVLAVRLAANGALEPKLPPPAGLVLHDPAGSERASYDVSKGALASIPKSTRLLVIQAEASVDQPNSDAVSLFLQTESIPSEHKNLLRVYSDTHGTPTLLSDHLGVQAGQDVFGVRPLDAIDWWGYARPTEGALAEAFGAPFDGYSAFCRAADATCDAVRDAGQWSDGVPVKRLKNAGDLEL